MGAGLTEEERVIDCREETRARGSNIGAAVLEDRWKPRVVVVVVVVVVERLLLGLLLGLRNYGKSPRLG